MSEYVVTQTAAFVNAEIGEVSTGENAGKHMMIISLDPGDDQRFIDISMPITDGPQMVIRILMARSAAGDPVATEMLDFLRLPSLKAIGSEWAIGI